MRKWNSKRTRIGIGLLGVLLLALGLVYGVGASPDDDDSHAHRGNPIVGTVVLLSWQEDDLFVQLDTNDDGQGEIWVKIDDSSTVIVDPNGNPLPLSAIQVGVTLTVTHYEFEHGYYEAKRVVVGPAGGSPSGSPGPCQQPLQGVVIRTFWFGDDFFVGLDTNADSQEDIRVKIKPNATITDPQGNRVGFEAIRSGVTLTLVGYKLDDDGYYEAWHVIVGEAPSAQPPADQAIRGTVIEVVPFGDDLFVRLDADGDGLEDYPVKIDGDTVLVDPNGNPVDPSAIQVGITLTVTEYTFRDGYYEAKRAVVEG